MLVLFSGIQSGFADQNPGQDESYRFKGKNAEILFDWFASAGGPEIRTDEWYWGFCKIWVETIATKSYFDGNVRNNPDGSFYPGDGFGYHFVYGWAGDPAKCRSLTVCPIESKNIVPGSSQPCQIQKLSILSKKATKNGSAWFASGAAEISVNQKAPDHYIQFQINAERWGCHFPKNAPRSCGWDIISTVGSFSPSVIKPEIGVSLSQEYLNDSNGHKSGNLDHTYYLWDAINIIHNPLYQWKQERVGTISVKITRQYELKLEKEFQCSFVLCNHVLILDSFEPWQRQYQYGSGSTIYNATENSDIRKNTIFYKVDMYNLGRLVHSSQNKTDLLVVIYDPVYLTYPYLVLKDEYWWSWANRHGVALQYKGSIGGGADDTFEIHQNRRSKINSYEYSGYAFDPILPKLLNQSLSWISTKQTGFSQSCSDVKIDPTSLEAGRNDSVMFVKAGYGKITFLWPILKTMLDKRYTNATINNTLQSENFAGLSIKNLTEYSYQYPDVKFHNPVKILTYNSDGSRTNLPVSVKLAPDFSKDTQYTHDYTCDKVFYDTAEAEFAEIVVGDMYGKENEENGAGFVNLKTKMTSTWFSYPYSLIINNTLDLPIVEGYKALSPYEITITVGEKTRVINRIVNFLSPFIHVVNLDSDNQLNVTEEFGFVRINSDEKFGEITKIMINGREINVDCTNGCTTTSYPEQSLDIQAWNVWGGQASYHLVKPNMVSDNHEIDLELVSLIIITAISSLILWRIGSQALEYVGFKRN